MPTTYEKIATSTLGSSTATVTFSSIPSTYTDLVIVVYATQGGDVFFQLNGDTGSNYSNTYIYNSTSLGSVRTSNDTKIYINWSSNGGNYTGTLNVMNYSNATTFKTTLIKDNINGASVDLGVGLWRNTAAVNSISFKGASSYGVGSSFTLYGIKAA